MFLRILRDSFLRQKRRKTIVLAAVALGTMAASALGDIALDVGDKVGRELKSFGANLVVLPRGGSGPILVGGEDVSALRVPSYLAADEVLKVKDNFWKNNILGFAPVLDVPAKSGGRSLVLRGAWFERSVRLDSDAGAPATTASLAGLRALNPFWSVEGHWPSEPGSPGSPAPVIASPAEALVGRGLAEAIGARPGGRLNLEVAGRPLHLEVAGILSAGGEEDGMVLVPLESAQEAAGLRGRASRVLVSALTTPESAVYERLATDPRRLPPEEFERWTCTPFVSSVAYELERAWPGTEARVIRRVAGAEGAILSRASGLMAFIAAMAALGAALTVTSALTTGVLERRAEIGLLKALGASSANVVGLFLAEAALVGVLGGVIGAAGGALLARIISLSIFGAPVDIRPAALPLSIAAALLITLLGSLLPARRIADLRPAEVLRGR
ncbi:MAG TPA: ABC transporter permease [Candidatus Cryosericum sp.]|nr:ABC transporter permease [Candidatus Cryosericum sp.]